MQRWEEVGYSFRLDWLLRNATAVASGRASFDAVGKVTAEQFRKALADSVSHVGGFLDTVSGRLGLDHNRVLMGRGAFPVISRLLELNGGDFDDAAYRDRVLYWYVHTALWGRYTGSTETYWQQDFDTVAESGVDGLIRSLEQVRGGSLEVRPEDFEGSTRGSRFYPLLYMLTRVKGARDFGSGLELRAEMLGKMSSLEVHHLFPKSVLHSDYERGHINAIANFCFLTQQSNLKVSDRRPEEYFPEVEDRHPGVLASWRPSGYPPTRTCGRWRTTWTSWPPAGSCWQAPRSPSWRSSPLAPAPRRTSRCGRSPCSPANPTTRAASRSGRWSESCCARATPNRSWTR